MAYPKKIDQETLVETACAILEREGLDAVGMRRLAQELDVRASSLYHHFTDKSALLKAVAERGLHCLAQVLENARVQAGPEVQQQIRALMLAYYEWALLHPRLYLLLFGSTPTEELSSPITYAVIEPVMSAVTQLVGEEQAVAATRSAWSFVHGFVLLKAAGQFRRGASDESFLFGLETFVRGLTAHQTGLRPL